MKASQPWHFTWFGRLALTLGGLELAVPVMVLVAGALAYGTYLDSAYGAKLAKERVYVSWWFIALMGLVCVSLVFAVITRYPWKRKHVGFITVHAGLIALIAGGFWSLFGRVEGRLMLEEGGTGAAIETETERLELVEHRAGEFTAMSAALLNSNQSRVDLGGVPVTIAERWPNTREEAYVADDGTELFRAIEITFDGTAEGSWVGEESRGGAATIHSVQVRVLSPGLAWQPPAEPTPKEAGYTFVLADKRVPLGAEGDEAVPGWNITTIRRFRSAVVSAGGLTENASGPPNPAVEVLISDGQGTTERHIAFENFPDMIMARTLEGAARSGAQFRATPAGGGESLVIHGDQQALRASYVSADGNVLQHELSGPPPWSFQAGRHRVTILRQFSRARVANRFVQAAPASERRPALVVRIADGEPVVVPWKGTAPVPMPGRMVMLRYGPESVPLPFSVQLVDFRKLDYPGTDMAMAYESDVRMTAAGREPRTTRIFMNNPLSHAGWKVYQSGFVGETISIYSVMKDPGLPLTYIGCVVLVLGIVVTFYSRSFSWGHPGIAVPFSRKEQTNGSLVADRVPAAVGVPQPGPSNGAMDGSAGSDRDPGWRAGDAAGHIRAEPGGPVDRPIPVVG